MLLFDFNDNGFKVAELSPKLLGGESVSSYLTSPLKEGLISRRQVLDSAKLGEEVKRALEKGGFKIKPGDNCALSLHDERVFTLRLKVGRTNDGKDVLKYIDTQVETFIPESTHDIVSSFKATAIGAPGEVQFIAADKNLILGYKELFKTLGLDLLLVVPESYALYRLISPLIDLKETVIFLNLEDASADFIVMDKEGVLQTFTGSPSSGDFEKKIGEIFEFMEKRWARQITKFWLGGSAAGQEVLAKKFSLTLVNVNQAFAK